MGWIADTPCTPGLAALRAWGVTFLAATIAHNGAGIAARSDGAIHAGGLAGTSSRSPGNVAQRWSLQLVAMSTAAALSLVTGWSTALKSMAALIVMPERRYLYRQLGAERRHRARRARMRGASGPASMCGYAGGCIGPLGGFVLDLVGSDGALAWGLGFGHLALVTLIVLACCGGSGAARQLPRWRLRITSGSRSTSRDNNAVAAAPRRRDR
jgi:hypothetical protein